jgi:elongation factor P--(R)-beta-lysine ligase
MRSIQLNSRRNPTGIYFMTINWQPSAPLEQLQKRAAILAKIRCFFDERQVMEVETPLFSPASVTDPHIQSISAQVAGQTRYLQTSPEYAMKRLLCAGIGSIYQICKAFRQDESGDLHNPEFTILEWYRLGFDHRNLMNEVDELNRPNSVLMQRFF